MDEVAGPRRSSKSTLLVWAVFCLGLPIAMLGVRRLTKLYLESGRAEYVRPSSRSLKTVASAQADFRANDHDGNGVVNFWRDDIAGLYTLVPKGSKEPIKLIELSMAAADEAPATNAIARFAACMAPFAEVGIPAVFPDAAALKRSWKPLD